MRTRSLLHSFKCAFAGLGYIVRTQRNAKIHIAIALFVIVAGCYLKLPNIDWAILALTIGVVFAAEAFNTAIESVVDLFSPEYHDSAKVAKDVAAAAVLVLSLVAVVVGLLILGVPFC